MGAIARVFGIFVAAITLAAGVGALVATSVRKRIVPIDAPDADEVRLAAFFEPLEFHTTATAFRGGEVELWYGGGIIDLRDATLDPAGATLKVRAIFGGAQLVVPETWDVTTNVVGIGGAGDGRTKVERPAGAPRLTIEGMAMFGGFGISSEVPAQAVEGLRTARARRRGEPAPVSV